MGQTLLAVLVLLLAAVLGFFIGIPLGDGGGAISLALIAGFACIISALEHKN